MATFYSKRDLHFQLFENQNCLELLHYPYFSDHSKETFALVLDAAEQIAEKSLDRSPLLLRLRLQYSDGRRLLFQFQLCGIGRLFGATW